MDKDYFVTWRILGAPTFFYANIIRLVVPPHDYPKGSDLQELIVEGLVMAIVRTIHPDVIEICSICELPNPMWCLGQTREVVVGGRAASLEAGHNGWRIHL